MDFFFFGYCVATPHHYSWNSALYTCTRNLGNWAPLSFFLINFSTPNLYNPIHKITMRRIYRKTRITVVSFAFSPSTLSLLLMPPPTTTRSSGAFDQLLQFGIEHGWLLVLLFLLLTNSMLLLSLAIGFVIAAISIVFFPWNSLLGENGRPIPSNHRL